MAGTVHSFAVGGETVDLHALGLEPLALRHEFGRGATLTMRQAGQHHRAALQPGTAVTYYADGVARFTGQVRASSRGTNSDDITYTVADALARASSIDVTITATGAAGGVLALALAAADWQKGDGIDALTADVSKTVTAPYRVSLDRLLEDVMGFEADHRLVVNPASSLAAGKPVIDAVQVYDTGDVQDLTWGGNAATGSDLVGRVTNIDLSESIDRSYTAVEVIGPSSDGGAVFDKEVVLSEAWDGNKTATWTIEAAGNAAASDEATTGDPEAADSSVFRLFKLPDGVDDFDPELPWKFMVRVPIARRFGINTDKWYPIQAEYRPYVRSTALGIPLVDQYIKAHHPMAVKGDVRRAGSVQGPEQAKLIYQATKGGGDSLIVRYPTTGHAGAAHDRYGVESVRRVEQDDVRLVTVARAEAIHNVVSGINNNGRVDLHQRLPDWAWSGRAAVRVSGLTERGVAVNADYQSLILNVTGWSIDFGGERFSLDVTDDRERFVRVEDI